MNAFNSRIKGIPCQIQIDHCFVQPPFRGSPWQCDNPFDYYGYREIEFTVRDRTGYLAPWLERKIDDKERERIENEIVEYFNEPDV